MSNKISPDKPIRSKCHASCAARSSGRADRRDKKLVSCRGFTLIELSVVVVIIAVLAVLLINTTMKMVDRGNSAECVGNLRQLFQAAKTWEADKGEPLMHFSMDYSKGSWVGELYKQLNLTQPRVGNRPPSCFGCPSSKGVQSPTNAFASDYGRNMIMQPDNLAASNYMWRGRIVPNPSKVMMFGDSFRQGPTVADGRDLQPFTNGAYLGYRHGGDAVQKSGRANVIFYDGHAESARSDGAVIPHAGMSNLPRGYYYHLPPWQPGSQ